MESYDNIEESKFSQEYDSNQPLVNILDDLWGKKIFPKLNRCSNDQDKILIQFL